MSPTQWANSLGALTRISPALLARIAVIVNLLLVAMIAFALARLTWLMVPTAQTPHYVPEVTAGVSGTAGATTSGGPNAAQIAGLHLFGKVQTAQAVAKPPPEKIPDTPLQLELRGLLASEDQGTARALIADASRVEKPYAVGASVPGGATLEEIHADHVVLSRNGRYETLRLPKQRLEGAGEATAVSEAVDEELEAAAAAASMAPDPRSLAEFRDTLLNDPQSLVGLLQAEPVYENNQFRGYKLGSGQDLSMLRRFGLRRGDVVTGVNDVKLDSPAKVPEILRALSTSEQLKIEYERMGRPRSIVLNMGQ